MKNRYLPSIFASLLLLLVINQSIAQKNTAQQVAEAIEKLMQSKPVVGLSVAVVKDNKIIYNHSFGYKDLGQQLPLENQHIFRIASISKSFTTTAIMQLVAKKQLNLDQDVSELVGFKIRNPRFPNQVISLKMILSHRSSINDS